jgi:hypothetical protein
MGQRVDRHGCGHLMGGTMPFLKRRYTSPVGAKR